MSVLDRLSWLSTCAWSRRTCGNCLLKIVFTQRLASGGQRYLRLMDAGRLSPVCNCSTSKPKRSSQQRSGIIMSMHLFEFQHPAMSTQRELRLLVGYESGAVTLWGYLEDYRRKSIEGIGWRAIWATKLHAESGMRYASIPSAICWTIELPSYVDGRDTRLHDRTHSLSRSPCRPLRHRGQQNSLTSVVFPSAHTGVERGNVHRRKL
jgi:hypothetical protein